jgi:hypothetical protein
VLENWEPVRILWNQHEKRQGGLQKMNRAWTGDEIQNVRQVEIAEAAAGWQAH